MVYQKSSDGTMMIRNSSNYVASTKSFSSGNETFLSAEDLAEERFEAASWLQSMVGPLDLSEEPSEEELRICLRNGLVLCNLINKVHPGAIPKVAAENVKNFIIAVEEMNLPSFDVSDLEGGLPVGWSVKLVDCILSLKAYYEREQSGRQGVRKLGVPFKTSARKQLITKQNVGFSLSGDGRTSKNMLEELKGFSRKTGFPEDLENSWVSSGDSSIAWVQHVCRKYVDTFMARRSKSSRQTSILGIPDTNMPCEALLKLVMAVLDDKNPDEVAMLVEFMLKKVIEEFGQRAQFEGGHEDSYGDFQGLCVQYRSSHISNNAETLAHQYASKLELRNKEIEDLKLALESAKHQLQNLHLSWEKEKKALDVKIHGLTQAAADYHKVVAENRELYNQVQDLKGNIRVYCRVRPFLPGQRENRSTIDYIGDNGSIMVSNPLRQGKEQRKTFTFSKVFGPSAAQDQVFLDTQPLIRSVLDGYNVCIFAYGQTGSGKTYTMMGPNNLSPMDWGVNFRALHDLFLISQHRQDYMRYEVGVQMIEIYNEQVRDLLSTETSNKKLEIRNSSQQNGLNVPDANLLPVSCTEDVLELMAMGHKNRAVGSTALNERSSRSHSVLTVHVKGTDLATGGILRGCLHLVDLAGSERVDKSEATGDRLKEAQHINKSLSALGDVIAALAQKTPHVPYRNSKLTQLLQDSLGGQAKTLMFVHVSPDCDSYGETISTLKFAERVSTVELGAAQSNKESGEVKDLKDQVAFLKDALVKKDAELERYQRENRLKGNENSLDRSKKGGFPLEDQVCDWVSQKHLPNFDFDAVNEGTSSESMSSSGTTSEVLFPTFPPIKSKVSPNTTYDESEPSISPRNAYERMSKFSVLDRDYDVIDRPFKRIDGQHEANNMPLSLHVMVSSKSLLHGHDLKKKSSFEEFADNGDSYYLMEDSIVARQKHNVCEAGQKDYIGEDEEIISDYTEVEMQQHIRHIATVGNRRKGDKWYTLLQPTLSLLVFIFTVFFHLYGIGALATISFITFFLANNITFEWVWEYQEWKLREKGECSN